MRKKISILFLALVFSSCTSQTARMIIHPEPRKEIPQPARMWVITESQNGGPDAAIPEWVNLYLNGDIPGIEALAAYKDAYIFVGENSGSNFAALSQWAASFTAEQDLPRLAAARIKNRMTSAAALYPDDEYGDFYETFIKTAMDMDYTNSAVEDRFWVKRNIITMPADTAADELPRTEERYDFLVLVSVNRITMQNQIRGAMDGIKTKVPPTRDQTAAISRIKQTFFERF